MVTFVGAGPGAEDLITVRGAEKLKEADIVIYAGSLVNPALLSYCKKEVKIYNSAEMTLEEIIEIMEKGHAEGCSIVRLQTGDPSLYGAIREQMDALQERKIPFESVPGVSSFLGAAAMLNLEYTLPGISQSLIITRAEGRTPMPDGETIHAFATHQTTMALFLSASLAGRVQQELLDGGYDTKTPVIIAQRVSWPDEQAFFCTVGTLEKCMQKEGITKTALILVGNALKGSDYDRSKLYDPGFTTEYREGTNHD